MTVATLSARARERLRCVTPEAALGFLPWSLTLAATASLGLIALHVAFQQRTDISQAALSWTLAALVPALVLAFAPSAPPSFPPRADRAGIAAWALALNAGVVLLFFAAYSAVWQTEWDTATGWRSYAYFNKRWLAALYGIAVVSFLVLPLWIDRWLRHPQDRAASPGIAQGSRRWHGSRVALEVGALLVAVWYLAGPPWNIATHHRVIDFHEQVHLGPLQAIATGHVPYIGPASTQYGPGAQLAIYAYMRVTNQFSLVGFREAFVAIHLLTFVAFALVARAHAGARSAWLVLFLGVICSPLRFFAFVGDGSPGESYGWGNAGRYLAALVVIPCAGVLVTREIARWRAAAVALGIAWGALAWFAQENLASVITGGGLLSVVLLGAGATTWRKLWPVAAAIGAGFAVVWLPVLAWYAWQGLALRFLDNYSILPRAVAAGFQNTWFTEGSSNPLARAFRFTPAAAIAIGLLSLWDFRQMRVRAPLDRDQIRLVSFICVLLACFQGALYRSDSLHTLNVLIALPFVLALAFRDLPAWVADTWTRRAMVRVAIGAGALWMYPLTPQFTGAYAWILNPPSMKYSARPVDAAKPPGTGVAFVRATAALSDEPTVAGEGTGPMRQFLADASALHDLVGNRTVFVESAAPYFTGLIYFMADLTPAPYLYDIETLVFNDRQQSAAWSHFQKRIAEVECVIVASTDAFEARAFRLANPSARVYPRRLGAASLYVIMNGGPDTP